MVIALYDSNTDKVDFQIDFSLAFSKMAFNWSMESTDLKINKRQNIMFSFYIINQELFHVKKYAKVSTRKSRDVRTF